MRLRAGVASRAKRGNSVEEYEDAFFPPEFLTELELPFACAVADGATESSFSGLWAKLLTEAYTQATDLTHLQQLVDSARGHWHEKTSSQSLPWYAEQKLEKGAYATLLGVTIDKAEFPSHLKWEALAVGDSCLFHVRNHEAVATFPIKSAEELTARPMLLPSIGHETKDTSLYQMGQGILETGDRLYLVTDAIAGWIFTSLDRSEKPLDVLDQIVRTGTAECFHELVERLWDQNRLKNDDCTVLWIDVVGNPM